MALTARMKQAAKEATEMINGDFTLQVPAHMAANIAKKARKREQEDAAIADRIFGPSKQTRLTKNYDERNAIKKAIEKYPLQRNEEGKLVRVECFPEVLAALDRRLAELEDERRKISAEK